MKTLIKSFKGKEFIFNLEDAQADELLAKDKRYREKEKEKPAVRSYNKKSESEEV